MKNQSNDLEVFENVGFLIKNIIKNHQGVDKDLKFLTDLNKDENL